MPTEWLRQIDSAWSRQTLTWGSHRELTYTMTRTGNDMTRIISNYRIGNDMTRTDLIRNQ